MNAALIYLAAAGVIGITNWVSLELDLEWWDPVSKPAVILALIFSLVMAPSPSPLRLWMMIGLAFSLLGDVFLLMKERLFLVGLFSFLLAHAAFILAFNPSPPPKSILTMIFALGTLTISSWFFSRLYFSPRSPGNGLGLIPLILYTLLITASWFSGLTTLLRPEWLLSSAAFISAGASLFYMSDAFLAWHRYISPLNKRDLKVRITYHVGQICLVMGTLLYGRP